VSVISCLQAVIDDGVFNSNGRALRMRDQKPGDTLGKLIDNEMPFFNGRARDAVR
jgi:hypothetical protein